jgi:lysophospholipase L1-like esterase
LGPGPVSLFGVALDLDRPGVRYEALGLPGSTAVLADGYDRRTFVTGLRDRKPDLYVLFWGTNEAGQAGLEAEELRTHYVSLLGTLREAAPEAECLILGPTDRVRKTEAGWSPAPSLERVLGVLRDLARTERCAFWSPRAAMGGPRAMLRWQSLDPPLGHADGVHLTPKGYEALADALVDDLLDAYEAQRGEPLAVAGASATGGGR